jgi:hypothetical protein
MTFRRLSAFLDFWWRTPALALALLVTGAQCGAQSVVVHLRNGDRITGAIISESTNQLVLSNILSRQLVIPMAQIERREVVADIVAVASTNAPTRDVGTNNAAGGILPGKKVPALAGTNTFWKRWKGEVTLGVDLERGALNHQLFYGRAKLTYAQPYESDPKQFFRNIFNYDAEYGKTQGILSDNRMGGSSKTDFDLSRKMYVYNLGAASYDEVRKINVHYEEGPGVGYHWITRSNFVVNLELGANYQVESRTDNTDTHSAYFRLGQDMTWKLNKQMNLTEKFEYFPRVGYTTEYRMRFESTLSYALMFNISLNFSVIDLYDTQPTAGVPNNDLQLRTSLGVKF